MQRAYLAYKDSGVVFLGIFGSKEKEIKAFADKFHLTYPVGKENGIATILWVKAIPETLFIDREGRIIKRHSGTINYEELTAGINVLLKQTTEKPTK